MLEFVVYFPAEADRVKLLINHRMVLPEPLVVSTIIFLGSEESYKDDLSNNYETCEELEKL